MKPFRAALLQIEARDLAQAEDTLQEILRLLDEAGTAGADIAVLPECSYPAYYLGTVDPYDEVGVRPAEEVARLFSEKAKQHRMYVAAGMAWPEKDGALSNAAVLFDRKGKRLGHYAKSFLWHFDNVWFEPGLSFPVFEADFAKLGMLICADGRQPEVARSLAVNGAEAILDLTAWVSGGRRAAELTTSQCEYLMPVRARENGVWLLAADKHGREAGTIVYSGRSSVIGPDGSTMVCGPSSGTTVVVYDVEPGERQDLPKRRPGLYGELAARPDTLPVWERMWEYLIPAVSSAYLAVDATQRPGSGLEAATRRHLSQFVDVLLYPSANWDVDELQAAVDASFDSRMAVAVGLKSDKGSQVLFFENGKVLGQHQKSHGDGPLGESISQVYQTPAGYVGLMMDEEGLVPEVARVLMLRGADIVLWSLSEREPMLEQLVRARAEENRVFVAAASPEQGFIAGPSGTLLTVMPEDLPVAMAAQVNRAEARAKDRAPATSVLLGRHPEAYRKLVS